MKAAHPDDGWVDRTENSVNFAYPQFDDGVKEGDLICLGWHNGPARIVRITRIERSRFFDTLVRHYFEPVPLLGP